MAYSSWSVVFGEQPSAAKWNILGTNDASFNDGTGIANAAITSEHLNSTIAFRAYDSGGTTLNDNTITQINLATEVYDYGSDFASSAFTAPLSGAYHFNGAVSVSGAVATGVAFVIYIYVDGAEYVRGNRFPVPSSNDGIVIAADIPLTAGQVVTLRALQDSAGGEATATGNNLTWFAGHFIGA